MMKTDQVASAIGGLALQVQRLGNGDAVTPMGAIEVLSKSIKESGELIASGVGSGFDGWNIAEAIDKHGEQVGRVADALNRLAAAVESRR